MVRFVTLPTHNKKLDTKKIEFILTLLELIKHYYEIVGGEITLIFSPLKAFYSYVLEYIEESTAHILECTSLFSTRGLDRLGL